MHSYISLDYVKSSRNANLNRFSVSRKREELKQFIRDAEITLKKPKARLAREIIVDLAVFATVGVLANNIISSENSSMLPENTPSAITHLQALPNLPRITIPPAPTESTIIIPPAPSTTQPPPPPAPTTTQVAAAPTTLAPTPPPTVAPVVPAVPQVPIAASPNIAPKPARPDICEILFVWYGWNPQTQTWTGGLHTSHWSDSPLGIVNGQPSAGYYSSPAAVPSQLQQIASSGADCVMVDWLGSGVDNFRTPNAVNAFDANVNQVAWEVFAAAKADNLKVTILVDSYYKNDLTSGDFNNIVTYVQDHFYGPFASEVLQFDGKPLLTFFNSAHLNAPQSNNLDTIRVIGNNNIAISPGWWWLRTPTQYFNAFGGSISDPCVYGYCGAPVPSPDGEITISPSYNDLALYPVGRSSFMQIDPNYSKNFWGEQWSQVIAGAAAGNVKLVVIDSWNEWHELTRIEPGVNNNAPNVAPNSLVTSMQQYVSQTP